MGLFDRAYYDPRLDAMVEIAKGELHADEENSIPCCESEDGVLRVILYRGFSYERTFFNCHEKIFADLWEEENRRQSLLDMLLGHCGDQATQRDEYVAAGIVQWLGTNCGHSFLEEALKRCGYELKTKIRPDDVSGLADILTSGNDHETRVARRLIKVQYWCDQNQKAIKSRREVLQRRLEEKLREEIITKTKSLAQSETLMLSGSVTITDNGLGLICEEEDDV